MLRFIEVLDNLDRALESAEQAYAGNPLIEGLILVRTQLLQILQKEGLERVPVLGLPFDPASAEAVGIQPVTDPDHDHVVVKELLRGYRLHGRLARASRVLVGVYHEPAPAPPSAEPSGETPAGEASEELRSRRGDDPSRRQDAARDLRRPRGTRDGRLMAERMPRIAAARFPPRSDPPSTSASTGPHGRSSNTGPTREGSPFPRCEEIGMSTKNRASRLTLACIGLLLAWPGRWADAAPAEYDFANLGAAVGGFKPQGNRFLVSDTFAQDGPTTMYLNVGDPSATGQVIKADNTNLARFDFEDMKFCGCADDTIQTMTITGTLAGGGTTSVTVTNRLLAASTSYSLVTDWGANLDAFVGVTQLSFDITMAGTGQVWNIDFQSITIDNQVQVDLPGVTPTIQASSLGAVVIGPTETTLSWTNGNGSNRILFALAGTAGAPTVTDGTSYTS